MLDDLSERPLRLPQVKIRTPRPDDPMIFGFNEQRESIVDEVVRRVMAPYHEDRTHLELALNDAAVSEVHRLERQRDKEAAARLSALRGLVRSVGRMSDHDKRKALDATVAHMAQDVAGNFDPRVYEFARRVIPKLLMGTMRPSSLPAEMFRSRRHSLIERLITVQGPIDQLKRLEQRGTMVYVPTHSSNLDSIVLAQSLEMSGLSPVVYGAGKNLFTNPIISFFMHNLGAYRVDRRIGAQVYKDVLKTYSTVMIERGYHSLFFPGGTRSRSGMIESRLKLGLMGSAISAFAHNQSLGVARPVYFVPTTINYALVLEAETLVEDWLAERGRSRYIIEDDEFSEVERWLSFLRKLVGLNAACVIRYGAPVDPFGNPVDSEGASIAPSGKPVDPGSYVRRGGHATVDPTRDAAYTRGLGELLVERYREETVIMTTQLVAHVLFRRLVMETPGMSLYARLRQRGWVRIPRHTLCREIGEARDALLGLSRKGEVRLSPYLMEADPEAILERAMAIWDGYHRRSAAVNDGREITTTDPTLLLYYQNRLIPFAEAIAPLGAKNAAREIARLEVPR